MLQLNHVVTVDVAFDDDVLVKPLLKVVSSAVVVAVVGGGAVHGGVAVAPDERQHAKAAVRTVGQAR